MDWSSEMHRTIIFAAETYSVPHLSFQVTDTSDLPFDSEFDIVFSNAALHWIVSHGPVLKGIRRALKPGDDA